MVRRQAGTEGLGRRGTATVARADGFGRQRWGLTRIMVDPVVPAAVFDNALSTGRTWGEDACSLLRLVFR